VQKKKIFLSSVQNFLKNKNIPFGIIIYVLHFELKNDGLPPYNE